MGTVANAAQAIQSRDAQSGGEVPVRTASHRSLAQLPSEFLRNHTRLVVKQGYTGIPFEGRTIDAAGYRQLAFPIEVLQQAQLAIDAGRIFHARNAHVERSRGLSGNYIDS